MSYKAASTRAGTHLAVMEGQLVLSYGAVPPLGTPSPGGSLDMIVISVDDPLPLHCARITQSDGSWSLCAPMHWLAPAIFAPALCLAWLPARRKKGHCPRCGYDLTGIGARVCPECGKAATPGAA
jgi:hypothetical protein